MASADIWVSANLFATKLTTVPKAPKPQEPTKRHRRSGEDLTRLRARHIAKLGSPYRHNGLECRISFGSVLLPLYWRISTVVRSVGKIT
jgi:hypothetical protein